MFHSYLYIYLFIGITVLATAYGRKLETKYPTIKNVHTTAKYDPTTKSLHTTPKDEGPTEPCKQNGQLIPDKSNCTVFYECDVKLNPVALFCPDGLCFYPGDARCEWIKDPDEPTSSGW